MRSNITLKEIAYIHDLSISTISKALNDSAEISIRTKEKVKETAKAYNYRPNSIARNLKCNRSYTIGVIVPELSTPFFQQVMEGIMEESIKNDYKIMMYPSKGSHRKEAFLAGMLTDGSIDGLILSMADETIAKKKYRYLEELLNTNFPIVLLNNTRHDIDCDSVFVDYENCGFMAARKLIKKKRTHILLLTEDNLSGEEWENGFRKAILDNEQRIQDHPTVAIGKEEDAHRRIEMILAQYPKLDGIVVQNEKFATLLEAILKGNAKKNIAVVHYVKDTMTLPEQIRAGISYMTSDYLKLGEEATKTILRKIKKNKKEITRKSMQAFFVDRDPKMCKTGDFMENFVSISHFQNNEGIPCIDTL